MCSIARHLRDLTEVRPLVVWALDLQAAGADRLLRPFFLLRAHAGRWTSVAGAILEVIRPKAEEPKPQVPVLRAPKSARQPPRLTVAQVLAQFMTDVRAYC